MRMKVRLIAMDENSTGPDQKTRNSLKPGHEQAEPSVQLNGDRNGKFLNGDEYGNDLESSFAAGLRDPSRASSLDGNEMIGQTAGSPDGPASLPYVLNSTPDSQSGYSDKTPSPRANKQKTADVIMSPDRKVKAIKLKKDTRGALGLTVVGGEDSRRLHFGIFVKRVSPGSIAHEDGRLQVGDRILAVNGKSLEYVTHDEAVQALKNTPQNVELLVSQSTRTDSDIDMTVMSTSAEKRPSSSHGYRGIPYDVPEQSPLGKQNSHHSNDDVTLTNVSRDLESAYLADSGSPRDGDSPHNPRRFSGSSSGDRPASNASSPEPSLRNHHGGVKLPGMTDGKLEEVKLVRNDHFRTSQTSQVSLESPGSIASYGEKVNRQNSLPDPETASRKSSTFSALTDGRLGRSRSYSGITPADIVDERANPATLNGVSAPKSDNEQPPVGLIGDSEERRRSQEDKISNHFTVELDKVSGSLGLNVTGGVNTNVTNGAIFVKSLYPNGPADLDGRIQVGHKILSVNGISLQGVTHKQAVETIKRAPVHAVLVIEGLPGETAEHTDGSSHQKEEEETVFEVVLIKGIGGLGMSLVGGIDCAEEYGEKLRLKAMFPGQPAENSEKLRVGDIILAVNGVSLEGKTSRDAINVLRDQPTRVVLTVQRDPNSIPPSLLRRGSFGHKLDPREVLSAINSKIHREDSRCSEYSEVRPENESPSEIHSPHESASRKTSNAGVDNGRISVDENEQQMDNVATDVDNSMRNASTSQGRNGIYRDSASQDKARTSIDKSGKPDNYQGRQPAAKRLSSNAAHNNEQIISESNRQANKYEVETVETSRSLEIVSADDNHLDPDFKFEELSSDEGLISGNEISPGMELQYGRGLSSGSMSTGDVEVDVNHESRDTTRLEERRVSFPFRVVGDDAQSGGEDASGEYKKMKSSSEQGGKEKLAPDEEVLDIVLKKGSSGLGFTLAGGADTVGGCFVREIIGDPARSDGRLRPKDQIVMVNGQDTTSKRHMEAVNILRSTRNEVHLVIRRRPDKVKSKTEDGLDIKTISVIRTTRGEIGLTLAQDQQGQIYAAEVLPDEPAAKHGGLKRGDIILEINGERVDETDLTFATECLDRARPVVTLVIKQFRSETESKYVICSPTESERKVPVGSLQSHALKTTVIRPQEFSTQVDNTYNPDFIPSSEEPSPEDLPTSEVKPIPELLPYKSQVSEEQYTGPIFSQPVDGPLSPVQPDYEERQPMVMSMDESFSEEKMMSLDATQETENEKYPSDDEDLLLKEEIIVTTLEKGPRGLGFSLYSKRTIHDTPGLFIRSIQPNSVVEEDGKIRVNDQLLKVNSEDVETLDHSEVITLLRSLSGLIKLELLRVVDCEDDDEESPRQLPDVSKQTYNSSSEKLLDTSVSPVTTPDFTEDVDKVLNALNTNFPPSDGDNQSYVPSPAEERPYETSEQPSIEERVQSSDDERPEAWPQPPSSLELRSSVNEANAPEISNMPNNESVDNHVSTSEDDTTSVTFSGDDFLDEMEDFTYTPSPESDRVRTGNISEKSRIPVKPGSSLSKNFSPRLSEPEQKTKNSPRQEDIEMSFLRADKNTRYSELPVDNTTDSTGHAGSWMDNTMDETSMNLPEGSVSPLVPESFLNASQAVSSSQATTPEIPPPLPTTPIPSDEDLGESVGLKVSPRDQAMTMRERFEKVVRQENAVKGRFDFPLRPRSPLVNRRSKSVEPTEPLLEVRVPNSIYAGKRLQTVIKELENAISSGKAASEFQALREMIQVDNCPSGKRALNKEKNRYRNVLPYEKTRVILSGDEQVDYINANYIDITVDSDTYHYIATQGPLPITTGDFWRMVWEQQCQVIAMVTLDMESGKVKCHRYWPESPELPIKVNPSLKVHLESVETHRNYMQRIIGVEDIHEEQSFNVVHLNFVAWPDHGVPKSACDLVEFIKQFRSSSSVGPSIVHCSAGIGRTGTMLTIDTCMKYIERGLEFDIYSIVHNLRQQRPGMIQTKDQYLFCYQACVEILKSLKS